MSPDQITQFVIRYQIPQPNETLQVFMLNLESKIEEFKNRTDTDVWVSFNDGFRGEMESDVHILLDTFGIKPELDKVITASQEKRKI